MGTVSLMLDKKKYVILLIQDLLFGFLKKVDTRQVNVFSKFKLKQIEWFSNEINKG